MVMMRVLKTKTYMISAVVLMLGAPQVATAQTSASLGGLYSCEAIANKDAQLACFLTATAKLRAADRSSEFVPAEKSDMSATAPVVSETAPAPKEAAVIEKNRAADTEDDFGKKTVKPPKIRTVAIASTKTFGGSKYIRFTLENGEVWQQREAGKFRLGKATPDMLTIKRTSFGSYFARVNDKAPAIRVKRIN